MSKQPERVGIQTN